MKFLLFIILWIFSYSAFPETNTKILTALDCVKLAIQNSNEIEISTIDEQISETVLSSAERGRFLPKFDLKTYSGTVPDVYGDIFSASNDDNLSKSDFTTNLGFFIKMDIELLQPIYSFGKMKSYINMAKRGVKAQTEAKKQAETDVTKQILATYFGILLTDSLLEIIEETKEKFKKAETKVNELLNEESDKVKQDDKLKMELYSFELDKNENRVKKERELAIRVLKKLLNFSESSEFTLKDDHLFQVEIGTSLDVNISDKIRQENPQLKILKEAVNAKEDYLHVKKAELLPLFFLAGGLKYAFAPNRDDQSNPFVKDDFNYFHGGVFFGFEQKLNFWFLSHDYKKAKLEAKKIAKQLSLAQMGMDIKVQKIQTDINRYLFDIEKNKSSIKIARSLLGNLIDSFENFGDANIKDITDSFLAYINAKTEYYKSIYSYNIAVFDLSALLNKNVTKEKFFEID